METCPSSFKIGRRCGEWGRVSSTSIVVAKLAEGVAKMFWPSHSRMKSSPRFREVGAAGQGARA
jgi:hypothetical protein